MPSSPPADCPDGRRGAVVSRPRCRLERNARWRNAPHTRGFSTGYKSRSVSRWFANGARLLADPTTLQTDGATYFLGTLRGEALSLPGRRVRKGRPGRRSSPAQLSRSPGARGMSIWSGTALTGRAREVVGHFDIDFKRRYLLAPLHPDHDFSGSSTTCRETTARISARSSSSNSGWPRKPRSCARSICNRSRATGAEAVRPLISRSRLLMRPSVPVTGSSSPCARPAPSW